VDGNRWGAQGGEELGRALGGRLVGLRCLRTLDLARNAL